MCDNEEASEDMYYPPESADTCYDIRLFIISYFLSERLRPDTPPITHTLNDPAAAFLVEAPLFSPSFL